MKIGLHLILVSLLATGSVLANEQWGYEGKVSPEHWGDLSTDFTTCKVGKHQSPINITDSKKVHHHDLSFHYALTSEEVVNNGHTVQVTIKSDDDYLIYKDNKYYLKQFHFHTPSENLIQNKSFPLEVHFVHADKEGNLLVLAVMAEEGKNNPELAKAWQVVSQQQNQVVAIKDPFDINKFLPKENSYYHFEGSLTTPPCTEGVNWVVLKHSVKVSKEQVQQFEKLMGHHNNRPVQPINDREVDED